jgi:hypothetical protein
VADLHVEEVQGVDTIFSAETNLGRTGSNKAFEIYRHSCPVFGQVNLQTAGQIAGHV